jgi:uncharacterized protein YutE (UPF0331/DUF86 family)
LVDPESVRRRLRELDRRVSLLDDLHGRAEQEIGEIAFRAQVERHLQLAIQSAIDISLHVLAEDTGTTPEQYGQAFILLGEDEILDADLAARLRLAAGLRNILVHGYLEVDPEQLVAHLGRLGDLRAFARAVEDHLERD